MYIWVHGSPGRHRFWQVFCSDYVLKQWQLLVMASTLFIVRNIAKIIGKHVFHIQTIETGGFP